ncbi:MAG TPA: hypothetical protein VFC00_23315 [Micromonosporaceae bacterium]|nr:hypothetical protein [Micromonosporaceae bacterium]
MRAARLAAVLAALLAVVAIPGTAHADVTQQFQADSGDSCRYGVTSGTLTWRSGSTLPVAVFRVDVAGKLTDRPLPSDPSTVCRDDGFYSRATFVAYSGTIEVDREARVANNSAVSFTFTLGANSTTRGITHVVIQVCRSPVSTLPPSYCGAAVRYTAPSAA